MQDHTDFADTILWLHDFAEGLEAEVPNVRHDIALRLSAAAQAMREAISQLRPLVETVDVSGLSAEDLELLISGEN